MQTLMERQLDDVSAACCQKSLEPRGIQFLLARKTQESRKKRVSGRAFQDGSRIAAHLVVMRSVSPQIDLAKATGIYCERGIVSTTRSRPSTKHLPHRECVQHRADPRSRGAAVEQAKVCANTSGRGGLVVTRIVTSTKLKVTAWTSSRPGDFAGGNGAEAIVLQDPTRGIYKKLVCERKTGFKARS